MSERPVGPYTVWVHHAYEGWHPTDYPSLHEAVIAEKWTSVWVITRPVEFTVTANPPSPPLKEE